MSAEVGHTQVIERPVDEVFRYRNHDSRRTTGLEPDADLEPIREGIARSAR